jgi:integrase
MGCVYRRKVRFCTTCDSRLSRTADRKACEAAGHAIEIRELPTWWIKYSVDGRPQSISAETENKTEAKNLLKQREGKVADGVPITAKVGKLRFEEATEDLLNDYRTNGKRSLRTIKRRVELHLQPFFGGRKLASITTPSIRKFIVQRQAARASNGEINRELTALKRMFSLAIQAGHLFAKPHIPMLKENNIRAGFFEREQADSVKNHLAQHFRGIPAFAYITGWRTPSEILPLEWRRVDFKTGQVRLDAGTTKNDEGRVFPFTAALKQVLDEQRQVADRLQRDRGIITPYVFFYTVGKKAGKQITESGFHKAWRKARLAAGCPGKIAHDFRRTAVRNLEQAGVPRSVAMKLTGHKTEAVYRRYAIVSPGDLQDAVRKLDGYTSGTSGYTAAAVGGHNSQNP